MSSSPERAAADVLDTVVSAETPEGILLELRPAGLTARCYAFGLDWVVRIALIYTTAIVTSFAGGLGIAFWIILLFGLEWFYPVVFELTPSGTFTVLYSFTGDTDGGYPYAGLIADWVAGNLYGTTSSGGAIGSCNGPRGCGTVFQLTLPQSPTGSRAR